MRKFAFAAIAVAGLLLSARSAARAEDIDNPEYELWAKYKAGSFVVMKMETETSGQVGDGVHLPLKEITKDKAVVETKGHMNDWWHKIDIPANSQRHPRQGSRRASPPRRTPRSRRKAMRRSRSGGKKLKCHWTETQTEASGMKPLSKIWIARISPPHGQVESTSEVRDEVEDQDVGGQVGSEVVLRSL